MNFHDFYRIIFRYIVWCTHKKIKKPLHPPQKNEKMFETPKPKGAAGPHLIEGCWATEWKQQTYIIHEGSSSTWCVAPKKASNSHNPKGTEIQGL